MNNSPIRPLLTCFSVARTGSDELPGGYDARRMVWLVDDHGGPKPIVETGMHVAELATKTKAEVERDDPGDLALLEFATKTFVAPERDDCLPTPMSVILELATKTDAVPERDD